MLTATEHAFSPSDLMAVAADRAWYITHFFVENPAEGVKTRMFITRKLSRMTEKELMRNGCYTAAYKKADTLAEAWLPLQDMFTREGELVPLSWTGINAIDKDLLLWSRALINDTCEDGEAKVIRLTLGTKIAEHLRRVEIVKRELKKRGMNK